MSYTIEHFTPCPVHSVAVAVDGSRTPIIGYLGISQEPDWKDDPNGYPPEWAPSCVDRTQFAYVAAIMDADGNVHPANEIPAGFSHVEPIHRGRK